MASRGPPVASRGPHVESCGLRIDHKTSFSDIDRHFRWLSKARGKFPPFAGYANSKTNLGCAAYAILDCSPFVCGLFRQMSKHMFKYFHIYRKFTLTLIETFGSTVYSKELHSTHNITFYFRHPSNA